MEHTIDAQGKSMGRVATEAASILMGKNTTSFARHIAPDVTVRIVNASKAAVSDKKKGEKVYTRYSGYPGGLKGETLAHLLGRKGYAEAFRRAIKGMLPKNKLQPLMLKRLTVEE
ncbi:MAG: 50S ribosomal protein L13 [Candidatus Yonathbacteria bacterium]|nr:50S ribosomal protein L13 [Candidatus Yonathbacteria bacterium]NTW47851.1 50S ribosomal protein L13 [Candidatus Yonathbacteria bacterium]